MTTDTVITLAGLAFPNHTVEICSPAGLVTVPVDQGRFTADVPLVPNRFNHIFLTGLYGPDQRSLTSTTFVIHDTQDPRVTIDVPQEGDVITTDTVVVAGRVGDLLSGSYGLSVTINGIPAVVDPGTGNDGTFLAQNVPLVPDSNNVIQAVAIDFAGNQKTHEITATHVSPPKNEPYLEIESGNGQKETSARYFPRLSPSM